jgi:hypothetical protein
LAAISLNLPDNFDHKKETLPARCIPFLGRPSLAASTSPLSVAQFVVRFVTLVDMYSFLALIASLAGAVAAISPLTIKGTKFFDANGTQVYFKGNV